LNVAGYYSSKNSMLFSGDLVLNDQNLKKNLQLLRTIAKKMNRVYEKS